MGDLKTSFPDILPERLAQFQLDFEAYDVNQDGTVSVSELKAVLNAAGENVTDEQVAAMIKEVDAEGVGHLKLPQFIKLMIKRDAEILKEEAQVLSSLTKEAAEEEKALESDASDHLTEVISGVAAAAIGGKESSILVGPVIGKLTSTTARVLVETAGACKLTCRLTPKPAAAAADGKSQEAAKVVEVSGDITKDVPYVFKFSGLVPGTLYEVSFPNSADSDKAYRLGSLRTYSAQPGRLNVVVGSCDNGAAKRGTKGSMFDQLYNDYIKKGELDLFFRHGDQVYADLAFKQGQAILSDKSIPESEKESKIVMCYKVIYRKIWDAEDVRRVHAHASIMTLWDDHEIRNDWGTKSQDSDPRSKDYRIARCARTAYWQYQRQLWDDLSLQQLMPDALDAKRLRSFVGSTANITGIRVTVPSARNLAVADTNGFSDPYVKVYLLDNAGTVLLKNKCTYKAKTLNPVWEFKAIDLLSPAEAAKQASVLANLAAIRVELWEHDYFSRDDFMGEVFLRMGSDVALGGKFDEFRPVQQGTTKKSREMKVDKRGDIRIVVETTVSETPAAVEGKEPVWQENLCEGSVHTWGDFGLMVIDGRGARSFSARAGDRRTFIGEQQWAMIERALSPTGAFANTRALLVVHSMPVVMMSSFSSRALSNLPPQVDKMGFGLFPDEQQEYLDKLSQWKQAIPGGRDVFIVGGDLHFGVRSDVLEKGSKKVLFKQMVSSAISNNPPPSPVYWMLRRLMRGQGELKGHFFNHHEFQPERNFGLIKMAVATGGVPQIDDRLVTAADAGKTY